MRAARFVPIVLALMPATAVLGLGCEEKKAPEAGSRRDAGADKYLAADPKLARALQSAEAASAATDNGPPAQGVFSAGAADQRHPHGMPTRVDLAAPGADPRIAWARTGATPGDLARVRGYGPAILELGMQMGRTATPTIDFSLVLGPSKKAEGASGWLVAEVRKAVPAKEQLGQLPPGSERDIASMEGTNLRVQLTPDGRAGDEQVQLGKATPPELDRIAQNAGDALLLFTVPYPPDPVGVGGQWIAETRMEWMGIDVLAYRAYKVKAIEGDRMVLSLAVQAYAANTDTPLQGVPKGATLEQFDAEAQGECELVRGELLPSKGALQERMTLFFQTTAEEPSAAQPEQGNQPQRGMMVAKLQGEATLLRGDDLRAASAR